LKPILAMLLLLAASFGCPAQEAQNLDALWAATLSDLDDQPVALRKYQGRPLVINFWARWCGPCRDEIPGLIRERGLLKAQGLEVIGIAIEDKVEPVRDFAKAYEMDFPVLLAKDQGIALLRALGNTKAGLPYTLIIDRRGRVLQTRLGPMNQSDMVAGFAAAVK
jgi:thiol-disulfide isomerase/thioredoxin